MAIFSFRAQTFSRGKGQSAVAVAAYRSGQKLIDERTNEIKHYAHRAERVAFSQIMLPAGAPERFRSRQFLWNEVERYEQRKDARLAREIMVALPCELTEQQQEWLVREFVKETLTRRGYAADINIHKPDKGDPRNFHCHITFTDRQIGPQGFIETKDRALNSKAQLEHWRERWAALTNRYLERFGHAARVDHRSLVAQGIDREATIHLGWVASEMIARGAASDRGVIQAGIIERNALRATMAADAALLAQLELQAANENRLQVAISDKDVAGVIDLLTRRRATFGSRDLARFLARNIPQPEARAEFAAAVLAHPSIVALAKTPDARVTRYTTRAILAEEAQLVRMADKMAQSRRHRLPWIAVTDVLRRPEFAGISAEQVDALQHLTRSDAITILIGRAGTGKSYTLNALRQAYEGDGFNVVGLAFTNKVAQNLSRDGFRQASTIHSEMRALDLGRRNWNARTIVVVDEAAMLSTEMLLMLVKRADDTGAKLVLAGDDRQLPSIERGGGFTLLQERLGTAKLTTVLRQNDPEERRAAELLGAGRVAEALAIHDQRNNLRWAGTKGEAMDLLVRQWKADRANRPEASRFVFAYTNADVDQLNAALRQAAREADRVEGREPVETWLQTARGKEPYAAGDRLQLIGNDRRRGFSNGQLGTVVQVTPEQMTVRLDNSSGTPVSFDPREFPHFRHGYAGTIYKGQGDTIDRVMLLHTPHWSAESAYVALTRHREAVRMYISTYETEDLAELTRQLSWSDAQIPASPYPQVQPPEPTRPVIASERRRDEGPPRVAANDQRPIIAPTAAQGDGREAAPPLAGRRDGQREAGQKAGTPQVTRERWRVRADGSYERISGPAAPSSEQNKSPPVPPPRLPDGARPPVPAVPMNVADQAVAERRALKRGDLGKVQQMHRSTRELANEHIRLAQHPTANLSAWLAQDSPVRLTQPAAEASPTPEQGPAETQGAGRRSAVAGWNEKADRASQEASAIKAVQRLRGFGQARPLPRTTREIVAQDLALARDPLGNLPAWLAQDAPNPAFLPKPAKEPRHAAPDPHAADRTTGSGVSLRGGEVPQMRGGVDADRGGRLDGNRLPAGPAAGAGGPEMVQPVRGGGDVHPGDLTPPALPTTPATPFQPLAFSPRPIISIAYGAAGFEPWAPAGSQKAVRVPSEAPTADPAPHAQQSPQAAPAAPEAPIPAAPPAGAFAPIPANDERASQVRRPTEQPNAPNEIGHDHNFDTGDARARGAEAFVAPIPPEIEKTASAKPAGPEPAAARRQADPAFRRAGEAATNPYLRVASDGSLVPMTDLQIRLYEQAKRTGEIYYPGENGARVDPDGRGTADADKGRGLGPSLKRPPPR